VSIIAAGKTLMKILTCRCRSLCNTKSKKAKTQGEFGALQEKKSLTNDELSKGFGQRDESPSWKDEQQWPQSLKLPPNCAVRPPEALSPVESRQQNPVELQLALELKPQQNSIPSKKPSVSFGNIQTNHPDEEIDFPLFH